MIKMVTHKPTLDATLNFFEGEDIGEVMNLAIEKTNSQMSYYLDECMIYLEEEQITVLQDFLYDYTKTLMRMVCNVIESFEGDVID